MNELEIAVSEDSKVLLRERLDEQAKRRKEVETGIQEVDQAIREIERESVSHDEVMRALSRFAEIFGQIPPYQQRDLVKLVVHRVELASDSMKMALYGRVAAVGPVSEGARIGISEWLRGLVSQSAVLWDTVRLRVKRVAKGHTRITILPELGQSLSP